MLILLLLLLLRMRVLEVGLNVTKHAHIARCMRGGKVMGSGVARDLRGRGRLIPGLKQRGDFSMPTLLATRRSRKGVVEQLLCRSLCIGHAVVVVNW